MPVYQLVNDMPYDELLHWIAYLAKRPIGWREDDRTFKLIQIVSSLAGSQTQTKPWQMFPSLNPIYNKPIVSGETDMSTLKGSYLFHKMLSAKDGEHLNVD